MYANGGVIPAGPGDRIPVRFADREQLIYSDGTVRCYHADDGRFHDHGRRGNIAARRALLEALNSGGSD